MSANQLFLRFGVLGFVCGVLLVVGGVWGCGGSSSGLATTSDTVALTGTIMESAVSASISARDGPSREITEAAADSTAGHVYTFEGEDLGTFTTGTDGTFSCDVALADLQGSDDTAASFSEPVVVVADNGMELYAELEFTEGTATLAVGTANADSTLAAQLLGTQITGFAGWGSDYVSAVAGLDTTCLFSAAQAIWETSGLDEGGLSDDMAIIGDTIQAFMAAGGAPEDVGFEAGDWSGLMTAFFDGSVDDAGHLDEVLAVAVTANDEIDAATFAAAYAGAHTAMDGVMDVLGGLVAADGLAVSSVNLNPRALDLLREGEQTICEAIDTVGSALIGPMLAVEDYDDFVTTFADAEGIVVFAGLIGGCLDTGCTEVAGSAAAYAGMMTAYGGDFTDLYDSTTGFDSTAMEGLYAAAGACTGETHEAIMACGTAMFGVIYSGAGGWDDFVDDTGVMDATAFTTTAGYFVGQIELGWDPTTTDATTFYTDVWSDMGTIIAGDSTSTISDCVNELIAQGIHDTTSCYEGDIDDFVDYSGYIDPDDLTDPTIEYCGNGTCGTDETEMTCYMDCADDSGLVCDSDGICDYGDGETQYNCAIDCSSGTIACGNATCDMGESASMCPADCTGICGDWYCDGTENHASCPGDCPFMP